jgi:hypothetical protein
MGDNIINVGIRVNENNYENCVKSLIFLPTMNKKRIMIAGSGTQVNMKNLNSKINFIEYNENFNQKIINNSVFTNDKRNCDCCLIF